MKKSLIGLLLATLLVLTGFGATHAQDAPSTPADEPALRMPRYIAPAYTTLGTRNADGTPGPNYWQNHSVHDIAIEVMPPERTITGTQVITYTNNSPDPLPYVVVRLYQNARLPEAIREEPVTRDFLTDGIQIDEFSVNGQVMPWATFDDLLPFKTVKLVPLAQPLLPGASATFTFHWHYDLGLEYNREGVFDPTTFFIGYFFPRIATYSDTDAGLLPGWDLEEYTYRSGRELHNDFADFNYSVTVPKNFLVWATGELQNPDEVLQPDAAQRLLESRTSDEIITVASPDDLQEGLITAQTDTVTWRWKAENITDIALGVSDHYVWDAGSVVADPATDRRVSVHAAYAEELTDFAHMAQDVKEIVASVSSKWPGVPWPYSHAIVFVGGGDEEFPMMANDGSEPPMEGASVRFIAAHELLHSYFPFYMGIDERRYPFMDEGWTTAFEYLFNLDDSGQAAADALFIKARSGNLVNPHPGEEIPIIVPADATRGMITGNDGYEKPALAYLALKETMGDDAFKTSLHAFIDRWNGKRPLPWDMFNTFDDTADIELNWFFQNWFFESNYLDIAIGGVEAMDGGYAIQVENVGGAAIPFDVKVVYADDSEESFRQGPGVWQNTPAATTVTITTTKELKSVTLDGGIFVDATVADNTWSSEAAADAETATVAQRASPPTDELVQLRAVPWQWISFTSPVEQFEVEASLSYLLQFNDDATVNIVADCNNAIGDYQGEGGTLEIQIGPMTRAACPPASRGDEFVKLLGGAALYFFEDGNLHIDLFADGGTLVFSPAPPDLFGDDGEGAVAGLPDTVMATLGNLSYSGLFEDREVTLAGGVYTATSGAETIVVHLLDAFVALGDLNGDGSQDAVALLELDPSGSGRFIYAAPVLDVLTTPTVGTAVEVGDRIQPAALSITDGQVVAAYIGLGAGDGDCCPSWNIRHTFAWQDGALVEVSREEVSKVEAASASGVARSDVWEPVACASLGVQAEIAALADCGYVTVPENRAAGTDKTIQLAVVRIRSTSDNPSAPVILGTGGPGGDGLGRLKLDPAFLPSHAGLLESRDWIGFTQRGTAGAQPELPCPAFERVPLDGAMQGLTLEANLALRKTTLQACLDRYAAAGVDLTGYNSVENAADVVAVIDALGYDKVYYYGQSYGTMLGQYLLQDHVDRLAGIILDGIAPLTHKTWTTITDYPAAYERVFAACAADAACAAAYPEPEAALAAGLQALDANPPSLTVKTAEGNLTVSVDSTLAMRALFMTLYTPGGYATVPWLAYELRDGNFAPLTNNIAMLFAEGGDVAKMMHFAVVCSDDPIFSLDELVTDGVPAMYRGVQADDALDYVTACPLLALPQLPDRYDELAESKIPALLLQGGLDPATGVPVGSTVQKGLPNSTNVIFPASAHIVGNSPCAIALMEAFMRDPQAALDTSCVDPAIPFALPGPVSVTGPDGSATLGITLPGGYGLVGPGIWQGVEAYVGLTIEEAGTTADDAVAQQLAVLGVAGEATDGPEVAGLPSRMARVAHPAGDLEVYGFADADRSYAVFILVKDSANTEEFRQNEQPALLESVTLGSE